MNKTTELYYENAYLKEFDAKVLSCEGFDGGRFALILDKTAFFPEEGGQTSDKGVLKDGEGLEHEVLRVTITEEDGETVIRHIVEKEVMAGTEVHGKIDWERRFSNMQQHTGEHIFSGVVAKEYGFDNVGFHLSDNEVTMDYNGVLTPDDISKIELTVNKAIWENVKVTCEVPDKDKLASLDYRSKKELQGDVRIVTIEGYDCCACCAPHVERTGEIGFLKVVGLQNYKGGVRVNILCGKRALMFLESEHRIVSELSGRLTTSSDKVLTSINKLFEDNETLKKRLADANNKLMEHELAEVDPHLINVFLVKDKDTDQTLMRKTVNVLAASHSGYCGIFAGDGKDYRFLISSGTLVRDCKMLMDALTKEHGAKGGGTGTMIQGSLSGVDIDAVIKTCNRV